MTPTIEQIETALTNALRVCEASRQTSRAWGASTAAHDQDIPVFKWLLEYTRETIGKDN